MLSSFEESCQSLGVGAHGFAYCTHLRLRPGSLRFAATNHLLVEPGYDTTRLIEPNALCMFRAGRLLLHAVERGVEVGEVQTFPWGSFVYFADPDGNRWAVQ